MQTNMTLRIIIGFLALIPTGLIFYLTPGHLLGIN
jgi:hypothetical protein